jgi:hypothetical protein
LSFLITYYPWGNSPTNFTANGAQQGVATNVPSDGSALVAITFPLPYSTAVTSLQVSIGETTAIGEYELTVQWSSLTLTGFNVYVAGGSIGSTCSVSWQSTGS